MDRETVWRESLSSAVSGAPVSAYTRRSRPALSATGARAPSCPGARAGSPSASVASDAGGHLSASYGLGRGTRSLRGLSSQSICNARVEGVHLRLGAITQVAQIVPPSAGRTRASSSPNLDLNKHSVSFSQSCTPSPLVPPKGIIERG
jgi:hypothetical protein